MADHLNSFSSRVLFIPNYSAPLFVHVLDADERVTSKPLESIVQDILLVPRRRVVTSRGWTRIADMASDILGDEEFWNRVIKEELGASELWRNQILDFLEYYRAETARYIARMQEDQSFFAYQALSNLVYQASEGFGPEYDYGVSGTIPLPRFSAILNDELINRVESNSNIQLGRDDLRVWRQVNGLILNSVSQEFKQNFSPLLSYEIPFGLSPETKSDTLEALIKHSRVIAVVPVASGLHSISTALSTQQWVLALEATATTGAVLIILMGSIGLADVIVRWIKKREVEGMERQ